MSTYVNSPDLSTIINKRADFARDMAAAEFGRHYPSEGSDNFHDRVPVAQLPTVDLHFKRGKHRRLPSRRSAG